MNSLYFIPFLVCLKNTGPELSILIKIAIIGVSHDNIKNSTNRENIMSKNLLIKLFKSFDNGISLRDCTVENP